MKTIYLIIALLFVTFLSYSQLSTSFYITTNNTTNENKTIIQTIKNDNTIKETLNKFSTIEILDEYNGKTLTFEVVLFDTKKIGSIDLKEKHNACDIYATEWSKINTNTNKVLILFKKDESKTELKYLFESVTVSKDLLDGQMPPLVMEYINKYIKSQYVSQNKENKFIIAKIINAFKNAFDQKIKNSLIANAHEVLNMKQFYIFRNGFNWAFTYYYTTTTIDNKFIFIRDTIIPVFENILNKNNQNATLIDYYTNNLKSDFDPLISKTKTKSGYNYNYDQELWDRIYVQDDNKYYKITEKAENNYIYSYFNFSSFNIPEVFQYNFLLTPDIYDGTTLNPDIVKTINTSKTGRIQNHPRLII